MRGYASALPLAPPRAVSAARWHVNLGSRQIKSAKLYVVDSGLLAR